MCLRTVDGGIFKTSDMDSWWRNIRNFELFLSNHIAVHLTREHTEMWITDFDKVWHKCNFQKNISPVFLFIGNSRCWRGENYPQNWRCDFVKYLRNDRRYRFCVNWRNYFFSMVYRILQKKTFCLNNIFEKLYCLNKSFYKWTLIKFLEHLLMKTTYSNTNYG